MDKTWQQITAWDIKKSVASQTIKFSALLAKLNVTKYPERLMLCKAIACTHPEYRGSLWTKPF